MRANASVAFVLVATFQQRQTTKWSTNDIITCNRDNIGREVLAIPLTDGTRLLIVRSQVAQAIAAGTRTAASSQVKRVWYAATMSSVLVLGWCLEMPPTDQDT